MKTSTLSLISALVLTLSACGGGDDAAPAGGTGGAGGAAAGSLTISAANVAAQNTTLDLATASTSGNMTRAADGFSSVPYCEVFYENVTGANGKKYALQVYFRQSDKLPLHTSLIESTPGAAGSWVAFDNNSGAAITGVTVDTTARTIVFASKVLSNSGTGDTGSLSGTAGFGANASTPACGA